MDAIDELNGGRSFSARPAVRRVLARTGWRPNASLGVPPYPTGVPYVLNLSSGRIDYRPPLNACGRCPTEPRPRLEDPS